MRSDSISSSKSRLDSILRADSVPPAKTLNGPEIRSPAFDQWRASCNQGTAILLNRSGYYGTWSVTGSFVQKTLRFRTSLLYPLHVSSLQTATTANMEKAYENVDSLPGTDRYLGEPENLEHAGKNKWSRLWPVIVSPHANFQ